MISRYTSIVLIAILALSAAGVRAQDPGWQVDFTAFEHSHNVTAAVLVGDARLAGPDHRLAAFVDGEIRGVATPTQVSGGWLFFISIYGNASGEHVTFRAFDAFSGTVYAIAQALDFSVNGVSGSPSTPFWLETTGVVTTAERELPAASLELGQNYPNPFARVTTIPFSIAGAAHVRLEVFDLLGRSAIVLVDHSLSSGSHEVEMDATDLPPGVYRYRLITGSEHQTRLMVLVR